MNPQVFREYDIRGVVESDFDDAFVTDLGRAYATILHRAGKKNITLGRDCRLSSPSLRARLLDFSVLHWKMDGGVMITGSHNAAEYNGFKLGVGPTTIFGDEIQNVRRIIESRAFKNGGSPGSLTEKPIAPEYGQFILSQFKLRE